MKETVFTVDRPISETAHTVDEALELIGRGKFQNYVFLSCGLFLLATVIETLGISYIIPPAECELELDTFRKGMLSSVTFFGIAVTSHISGFLTDEFGRKRTVFISMTVSLVISTIAALIPDYWTIVVLRFISGMSISAASSGVYAYMSEFFPVHMRAQAIMFGSAISSTCMIFMSIVGLLIYRYHWEVIVKDSYTITGWRIQLLIHLIPGVFSLFLMHKLPESPKFLISVNRHEDCLRVLRTMFEKNTGESGFKFRVKRLKAACDQDEGAHTSTKSLKGFLSAIVHETSLLFKPPHLGLILSCCFIQYGCFFIAGGFGLWFPELNNRMSDGTANAAFCEIIGQSKSSIASNSSLLLVTTTLECVPQVHELMFTNNMVLGGAYLAGFLLLALGLNKISLKNTLTIVLILGTISGALLQHINNSTLLLLTFCLMILSGGVSIPLVNATAVDLFPTNLRGMAISMSILIGRMGTVTGANALGFLLDLNCGVTFYGAAALITVCAIFSACLPRKDYKDATTTCV